MYKMPVYRLFFEEKFIGALTLLQEAGVITRSICPNSGIFFETTLGSSFDISLLYSLKIKDLITYQNVEIGVRCSSVISSIGNHDNESEIQKTVLSSKQRIARCSSNNYNDCSGSVASNKRFSFQEISSNESERTTKSNERETLLLFETTLNDFIEGVEVLRVLFTSTESLCSVLNKFRKDTPLYNSKSFDDRDRYEGWILKQTFQLCLSIVEVIQGTESKEAMLIDAMRHGYCDDGKDKDVSVKLSAFQVNSILEMLAEQVSFALSYLNIDASIFKEMYHYYIQEQFLNPYVSVLSALDAILHHNVMSCFDNENNLIPKYQNTVSAEDDLTDGNTQEIDMSLMSANTSDSVNDEVKDILEKIRNIEVKKYEILKQPTTQFACNSFGENPGAFFMLPNEEISAVLPYDQGAIADDWVQYIDESTGKSFIYSAALNESRWLE